MNKNLIVLLLIITGNIIYGQSKVSGKVLNNNVPVEFCEVTISQLNNVAVASEITNKKGDFLINVPNGDYLIQIRQLNSILYNNSLKVKSDVNLGNINVTIDKVSQLESITVRGSSKKPLVERKSDRLIFNLQNTISATGGDALEALKVTPGVRVQNESVSISGKGSVMVMIDEKLMELKNEDLVNFLKSIPSDNIQSIEVITTPPAKYDAIGNSGLINIRMKKSKQDDWSVTLGSSTMVRKIQGESALTGNILYNKNRLNVSTSIGYRKGGTNFDQENKIYFPDGLWNPTNPLKREYERFNLVVNALYKMTDKWNFGGQYLINYNKSETDSKRKMMVYDYITNDVIQETNSPGSSNQKPLFHSVNLYNDFKINEKGRKVAVNFDYFNYDNNDSRPYGGTVVDYNPYNESYFKGININKQKINNYSAKIDFEWPLKWASLSFGTKVSFSNTDNKVSQFNSGVVDSPVTDMPLTDDRFQYDEDVQAVYFSGNKKFDNGIESIIGLRLETTQTTSNSQLVNKVENNYLKLFPSVNLSYKINNGNIVRLNYSRRIDRPTFTQLNPNITYVTPFQTLAGNPFLQPTFIDNLELIYTHKKLETKFYLTAENGLFNQVVLPDSENDFLELKYLNYMDSRRFGLNEVYTFNKFKWLISTNTLDINYSSFKVPFSFAKGREGVNVKIFTNNDVVLNSDKTLLFNVNYEYNLPETYGVAKYKERSNLSLGLQYMLMNKNLRISFKANDVLKTYFWKSEERINGIYQNSNYYFDARYFQLSLSYKFGSDKIKIQSRKTGNEEERIRTGN